MDREKLSPVSRAESEEFRNFCGAVLRNKSDTRGGSAENPLMESLRPTSGGPISPSFPPPALTPSSRGNARDCSLYILLGPGSRSTHGLYLYPRATEAPMRPRNPSQTASGSLRHAAFSSRVSPFFFLRPASPPPRKLVRNPRYIVPAQDIGTGDGRKETEQKINTTSSLLQGGGWKLAERVESGLFPRRLGEKRSSRVQTGRMDLGPMTSFRLWGAASGKVRALPGHGRVPHAHRGFATVYSAVEGLTKTTRAMGKGTSVSTGAASSRKDQR